MWHWCRISVTFTNIAACVWLLWGGAWGVSRLRDAAFITLHNFPSAASTVITHCFITDIVSKISIFVFLSPFWPVLLTMSNCWLVPRFCLPAPETTFTSLTGFLSYCRGAERQTLLKWDILPHWWQRLPLVQGTAVLPGMPCHTYHRGRFVGTESGGYTGVAIDGVVTDSTAAEGRASAVVVAGGRALVAAT